MPQPLGDNLGVGPGLEQKSRVRMSEIVKADARYIDRGELFVEGFRKSVRMDRFSALFAEHEVVVLARSLEPESLFDLRLPVSFQHHKSAVVDGNNPASSPALREQLFDAPALHRLRVEELLEDTLIDQYGGHADASRMNNPSQSAVTYTYGIIEILRRARGWMVELRNPGQRSVFGAMMMFCDQKNGLLTPTYGQITLLTGFHESSVRRIIKHLEGIGAVVRVGSRPVLSPEGIARGGDVPIRTIPPAPQEARLEDSESRNTDTPPAPKSTVTRSSDGAPLKVEKLTEAVLNSDSKIPFDECDHRPMDDGGYCTKCGTFLRDDA